MTPCDAKCSADACLVELRIGRKILRFAFRHAAAHPTDDQFELLGRERLIVAEIAEAFHRAPGRHAPLQHFFLDGDGPGARLRVGHQRESLAAVVMAGGAALIDDARDFAIPGDGRGDDVVRGAQWRVTRSRPSRLQRWRHTVV